MAQSIVADPAGIVSAANVIKQNNKRINDELAAAKSEVNSLANSWSGAAATFAMERFNDYYAKSFDARYEVMDNLAKTLSEVVAVNYSESEAKITTLASAFV